MKKNIFPRILLLSAAVASGMVSWGQASLTPSASLSLWRYNEARASRSAAAEADTVLATFEIDSPTALDAIKAAGAEVKTSFGRFAIVRLPLDRAADVLKADGVKAADFGSEARPQLDVARRVTGVDAVHQGTDIRSPFTGKDVVVGIVDQGLDPLHPAFIGADGAPRVKLFAPITESGDIYVATTADEMRRLQTDEASATHGTHVAGIAAGGHVAKAQVPVLSAPAADGKVSIAKIAEGEVPYYGVAPDADIVMTGGNITLSAVLLGVNTAIEYAEEQGKPAVVNMSLGTTIGPHNGSSLFSRALAELGTRAVVTISAGNEGDAGISIDYTASPDNLTLASAIDLSAATEAKPATQLIEIHGEAGKALSINVAGYNKTTGKRLFAIPLSKVSSGLSTENMQYLPFSVAQMTKFSQYFGGTAGGAIGVSDEDGARMAYVVLDKVYPLASNKNVVIGFEATTTSGTRLVCFASDADYPFTDAGLSTLTPGSGAMSISDMATGENIISVGAFNTRIDWPALDKKFWGFKAEMYPLLHPSSYSSYGSLPDGTRLPYVSAPGTTLVSSISRYYTRNAASDRYCAMVDKSDANGLDAYYNQMMGTSMAAPFTAGTIALWLEANPELTVDDVKDIIAKTAVRDDIYAMGDNAMRMGQGRIDALAGIKEALARRYGSGIGDVAADGNADASTLITADGNAVSAFMAGARQVTVEIYTAAGALVRSVTAAGSEAVADTSSLPSGIYIAKATDGHRTATLKTAVR